MRFSSSVSCGREPEKDKNGALCSRFVPNGVARLPSRAWAMTQSPMVDALRKRSGVVEVDETYEKTKKRPRSRAVAVLSPLS